MTYTDETTIDALNIISRCSSNGHYCYIAVPRWIEQDITVADVVAITEGGCASGAYMPAVTYHSALRTMSDYGDEVLDYLNDSGMDASLAVANSSGWSGMVCDLLSAAVEAWAYDASLALGLDGW
jgi:hypothetical protein